MKESLNIPLLASLLKLLKPSGRLAITSQEEVFDTEEVFESLKLAGFVNITTKENGIAMFATL